jgi:hypothetical protein
MTLKQEIQFDKSKGLPSDGTDKVESEEEFAERVETNWGAYM